MIYLDLFRTFFRIGLFSIGGGYASLPLIQEQLVDMHGWISMAQFADIMAIAEMTPGPIAINAATFAGIQVAGIAGALAATVGCVCPSCILVTLLAYIYYRFRGLEIVQGVLAGLRPAVVAMIGSAGISLLVLALYGQRTIPEDLGALNVPSLVIFACAFAALRKLKLGPVWAIAASGAAGVLLYSVF